MTSSYLFILGRVPKLGFSELRTFFPNAKLTGEDIATVEATSPLDSTQLLSQLGGTVKIAKIVGTTTSVDAQTLVSYLPDAREVVFGVSAYGTAVPKTLLQEMKKLLAETGKRARFIESRRSEALSSVVIEKNDIHELVLVPSSIGYSIARTEAVQEFEMWTARDMGRPHVDPKLGMLPLKVGRMIVNIALHDVEGKLVLLDPFCGMGTILSEALLSGWDVIGGDIEKSVIQRAQENLTWTIAKYPVGAGSIQKMLVSEAVHIGEFLRPNSVDAIVTEPYMGTTSIANSREIDTNKVRNTIKGLEKLYIGCLRNWHPILKPGAKVVIALPAYAVSGRTYFVKKVVDMCENLGYTIQEGPIDYSRPQAVVKREFYVLQKVS